MRYLFEFFTNKVLISGLAGWLIAQIVKLFVNLATTRKFDLKRLWGDGGMPSGHSSMVLGVATSSLLLYGIASYQFAIAAVIAIIVTHDATGVRRESGRHAKALNELMELVTDQEISDEDKLKEFLGHTHLQVVVGGIMGILIALFICKVIH
ncbi:MAG: divergent PAP2 family protein [Lachnospiraceae bacterium]|nr:divergent PAP2 family protein [Lachnospiraceae bacterium]